MAGGPKIQASSARAHTRKPGGRPSSKGPGRIGLMTFAALLAIMSWMAYRHIQPPPPKICGTPNGPPVTAPRVQLSDGRSLAYKEAGVQRENAKYKIVAVHGYGKCRHAMLGLLSEELMLELGVYVVGIDRAGYGQSTPDPGRTIKSDVYDVQDLADGLELGETFYVAVTSLGGITGYGLIKYLPHRLAGLAMFAPVTNYWWKGLPPKIANAVYNEQALGDRLAYRVARYAPWLVYWYMTQTLLPTSSMVKMEDMQLAEMNKLRISGHYSQVDFDNFLEPMQQGKDGSQFVDMRNLFGTWKFEPFELENPFATRKGSVHIWHGDDDNIVPLALQREVAKALPWVQYHEIPGAGHSLLRIPGQADVMIRALLQE